MNQITATVINVTPELARMWLLKNYCNRPLSSSRVRAYAHDMAISKWELNGEPVVFGADGQLKDGQHRLAAVAMSHQTIPMLVVHGVDKDVSIYDRGKGRSTRDSMAMSGLDPELNTNTISGTAKLALNIERKNHEYVTDADVKSWIIDHADSIRIVRRVCVLGTKNVGRINMATSSFYLAAIHAYECGVPETVLRDFFSIASSGLSTDVCHTPAIVLRNDVISKAACFNTAKDKEKSLYMCERAIYDFCNKNPRKLTYANWNKPIYKEVALA